MTREPFGPDSDLDVYVISPELFARAQKIGIGLRSGKTRTRAIDDDGELEVLGLPKSAMNDLRKLADNRRLSIMIYRDKAALLARSTPYMVLEPGDE